MTANGLPTRQVGATRWQATTSGEWTTTSAGTTWSLEYRVAPTPPLLAGWTLHRTPAHLVFQEPLYRLGDLVRALRWATGYVVAVRDDAGPERAATVLVDLAKVRNVHLT